MKLNILNKLFCIMFVLEFFVGTLPVEAQHLSKRIDKKPMQMKLLDKRFMQSKRTEKKSKKSKSLNRTIKIKSLTGNNKITGLPKLTTKLADELSRYTNFRSASLADWHPEKRELLIITDLTESSQIHQVKMPGGARYQLTFEKDNVLWLGSATRTASYDPVNAKFIVFSKDLGGTENNQTYRYDFDSGNITRLTDGKSRNTPGRWSNSGRWLAYESNRRNKRDTDLYLINPRKPKSDHLLTIVGGGGWRILDWSPDDSKILVKKYRSIHESYLWEFDTQTGAAELVYPKSGGEKISFKYAQYDKDGKNIYVLTDKDSEFLRLAELNVASGSIQYLSPEINWDVDQMKVSKDRTQIAYATNENGISVLHVYNTVDEQTKSFRNLAPGVISGIKWHHCGKEIGFSFASRTSPHDVYSLSLDSGEMTQWTFSETGGINPEKFDEPELVEWTSFDKVKFSGYVYRPPDKYNAKRPVIIYFHGGPEGQFRPRFIGRRNYFISELGIAFVCPNIRGSSGYGKSFLQLDDGILRANAYKDIKAVLDWVKADPNLDESRVMLMGRSYGGYMTLAGAACYSDDIRCAVDVVGPSNLVTFLENTSKYRRHLRREEYGDESDPETRAVLEDIAPTNMADKIKKPLLVIQGENDPRVPASEARQIVKIVRKYGVPTWYLSVKGAGHKFRKKPIVEAAFYTIVMFVKKFLVVNDEDFEKTLSMNEKWFTEEMLSRKRSKELNL